MGFPGGSVSKESTCNVGDLGSIPVLGRSPGGGHGNPLLYSGESPWTEELGGLQSMGSQRVGHDSATKYKHTRLYIRVVLIYIQVALVVKNPLADAGQCKR